MSHGGCSDCLAKRQALPTPRGKCSCRHQPFFVFIMNKTSDFWGPHVQGQWHIFLSGQRIYLLERTLFPSTWCLQYLWKCLILEPHLLPSSLGTRSYSIFYSFCPFFSLFHSSSQFFPVHVIESNTAPCPIMEIWNIALNFDFKTVTCEKKIALHVEIKSKSKFHWKEKWALSNFHCNLHVLNPSQYSSSNFGLFWPERIKVFLFWQDWQMLWLMIAKISSFSLRNVTTWFAYKQGLR